MQKKFTPITKLTKNNLKYFMKTTAMEKTISSLI